MAENEGRIALAIQAYQRGQFLYFKTAYNAYNAPYMTACKHVARVPARRNSLPKSRKLIDLEEQTLKQ